MTSSRCLDSSCYGRAVEKGLLVHCIIMDRSIRPPNFSWVEEGKIAAMAYPSQPGHFKYLQDEGVAYLVSLTPSKPKISEGKCKYIINSHLITNSFILKFASIFAMTCSFPFLKNAIYDSSTFL